MLFSSLVGPGWGGAQAKGRWESKGARESRGTGRGRDRGLQRSDCTETEMTQRGHVDAEDTEVRDPRSQRVEVQGSGGHEVNDVKDGSA